MNLIFGLLVALAVPFEDTGHRFHLELPPGWSFTPQPSDTGGATFRRAQEGALAYGMVRVMQLGQTPPALGAWSQTILGIYSGEPGFRLIHERKTRLAGVPAMEHLFVVSVGPGSKLVKMAKQTTLIAGETGFVVHTETLAEAFPLFERDFKGLLRSFAPGPGPHAPPPKKHRPTTMKMLLGAWQSPDATHTVFLSPQGAAVVDGVEGKYRLAPGQLIVTLPGGDTFYQMELAEGALSLAGGGFPKGQSFVRSVPAPKRR